MRNLLTAFRGKRNLFFFTEEEINFFHKNYFEEKIPQGSRVEPFGSASTEFRNSFLWQLQNFVPDQIEAVLDFYVPHFIEDGWQILERHIQETATIVFMKTIKPEKRFGVFAIVADPQHLREFIIHFDILKASFRRRTDDRLGMPHFVPRILGDAEDLASIEAMGGYFLKAFDVPEGGLTWGGVQGRSKFYEDYCYSIKYPRSQTEQLLNFYLEYFAKRGLMVLTKCWDKAAATALFKKEEFAGSFAYLTILESQSQPGLYNFYFAMHPELISGVEPYEHLRNKENMAK